MYDDVRFSERPAADSEEVASGIVLDFDELGTVVGIDIEQPAKTSFVILSLAFVTFGVTIKP
ncbi:MAG: DUF2283 domain-containing protein [Tepidiphilus sp.]